MRLGLIMERAPSIGYFLVMQRTVNFESCIIRYFVTFCLFPDSDEPKESLRNFRGA